MNTFQNISMFTTLKQSIYVAMVIFTPYLDLLPPFIARLELTLRPSGRSNVVYLFAKLFLKRLNTPQFAARIINSRFYLFCWSLIKDISTHDRYDIKHLQSDEQISLYAQKSDIFVCSIAQPIVLKSRIRHI